jgi:hypothetical protein
MTRVELGVAGLLWVGLSACNDAAETGVPDLSGKPTFAVQRADYAGASAIALIDGDGKLLEEKYLSSGTKLPGLNAALAADIALPTTPCDEGVLTLVGRLNADYVLRVAFDSAEVIGQVKTQKALTSTAFSGNPQDILCLGDGRALVSRLSVNLAAKPGDLDRGDDLLVIDLDKEKISSRIDLAKFQTTVDSVDVDGNAIEEVAYARPGSIVGMGDYALVGLSRYSESYSYADGVLALVDLNDLSVEEVDMKGLVNCGSLVPVADRDDAAIVQCAGAWGGDPAAIGVAYVSVKAGKAKIEHVFQTAEGEPLIYGNPTSLGGTRVVAVAQDFVNLTPDVAYVVDLESGDADELFTAKASGDIGSGSVRVETGLVLVPDASVGVRVFELADDELEAKKSIKLDKAIPARNVRSLAVF